MKGKRNAEDVVGEILRLRAELRKRYRMRQTVNGPVRQELPAGPLPRGENRKNIARILHVGRKKAAATKAAASPPVPRAKKPRKVARLIEHTEIDSQGRQITRFFGDPLACWGQFTHDGVELIDPRGTAAKDIMLQLHAAGLPDQQIAKKLDINVKTVERALKGYRQRARTRRKR